MYIVPISADISIEKPIEIGDKILSHGGVFFFEQLDAVDDRLWQTHVAKITN